MMRGMIFAAVASVVLSGCAGVAGMLLTPTAPQSREISRVYEVPAVGREKIHSIGRQWIAESFRSAKVVIEYDNKEEGVLIGNGVMSYPCSGFSCMGSSSWSMPFTMRMDVKDGRFRLDFANVEVSWPADRYTPAYRGPLANGDYQLARVKLLALGDEIVARIGAQGKNSDW